MTDAIDIAAATTAPAPRRAARGGFVLLLGMVAVMMCTNDSAREFLKAPVGAFHLIERDFFLVALLGMFLAAVSVTGRQPRIGRFGLYALALLGLYGLAAVEGVGQGNLARDVFFHLRQAVYLLVYFPFVYFVTTPARLRAVLKTGLFCVLAGAALTFVFAARFATSDYVTRNEFFWLIGGEWGLYFHVRLASCFFFAIALDMLIALWALKARVVPPRRLFWMGGLICGALALSVLRSTWVGLAVSLVFLLLFLHQRLRFLFAAAVVFVAVLVLLGAFARDSDLLTFIEAQAAESFDPDSVAVSDRLAESEEWVQAFRQRPWLGNGLGATVVIEPVSMGKAFETTFCHNTFLTLLAQFGIVGSAAAAAVVVLVFRDGTRLFRRLGRSPDERIWAGVAAGSLAGLVQLLASSLAAAAINYATGFFTLGVVLGILDRIDTFSAEGRHEDLA